MIDFAGYTFQDHNTAIVCKHVGDGFPVLIFAHDDDGIVQFMCGEGGHDADDLQVVGLSHLLEHIRSMSDMPTVDPGYFAERSQSGKNWVVQAISD